MEPQDWLKVQQRSKGTFFGTIFFKNSRCFKYINTCKYNINLVGNIEYCLCLVLSMQSSATCMFNSCIVASYHRGLSFAKYSQQIK